MNDLNVFFGAYHLDHLFLTKLTPFKVTLLQSFLKHVLQSLLSLQFITFYEIYFHLDSIAT